MRFFLTLLAFRKIFVLIFASILLVGVLSFIQIPRQEDPSLKVTFIRVVIPFPGADPAKIDKLVSKVVEEELLEIDSVEEVASIAKNDFALFDIQFDYNSDISESIDDVKEKINEIRPQLPVETTEPIIFDDMAKNYPIVAVITSDEYDLRDLEIFVKKFKYLCLDLPGVASAEIRGELDKAVYVSLDLDKISKFKIPLARVFNALAAQNDLGAGGTVKIRRENFLIQTQGEFKNIQQIENVVIDFSAQGNPIYVKDIAEIKYGHKDQKYKVRYNGTPGIALAINIKDRYNVLKLQESIQNSLQQFKKDLPQNIHLHLCIDQARHVRFKLYDLYKNLLMGMTCVVVILFLFLGFRESITVSLSIPFTVIVSLFFIYSFGFKLQQISIASFVIALGLLVDNSIVVIENIHHHLTISNQGILETFATAIAEVAPSITSGTLTTIAAFIPLLLLPGDTGAYVLSIPIVVITTLLCSLFTALTLTPIIYLWLCQKANVEAGKVKSNKSPFLSRKYQSFIQFCLKNRYFFSFVALILVAGSMAVADKMGKELFPMSDRPQFIINAYLPEGGTLEKCESTALRIEEVLLDKQKYPEIEKFSTFLGNGAPKFYVNEVGDKQPTDTSFLEIIVTLHHTLPDKKARSTLQMIEAIKQELTDKIFEADVRVRPFRYGKPLPAPIVIRVTGDNLSVIKRVAKDVKKTLEDIPGSRSVRDDLGSTTYKIGLSTDSYRLNRIGLKHVDISTDIHTAFSGKKATSFRAGDDEIDVVIRLREEDRKNFSNIKELYFTSRLTNEKIPFDQIAKIDLKLEKSRINRWNQRWSAGILCDTQSGVLPEKIVREFEKIIADWQLPTGIKIAIEGERKEMEKLAESLNLAVIFAFLLIFIILASEFNSLFQPIIIVMILPLAIAGAVFGLAAMGFSLAFMSMLGFISLLGIVVNDAIILVDFSNARIKKDKQSLVSNWEKYTTILVEAAEQRLKPIFTTSITTICSLLPLALSGSVYWEGFAWAIIFGLALSTFLTLVYVPVFFRIIEDLKMLLGFMPSFSIHIYTKDTKLQKEIYHLLSASHNLTFPEIETDKKLDANADLIIIDDNDRDTFSLVRLLEKTRHAPHISSIIISDTRNAQTLEEEMQKDDPALATSYAKFLVQSSLYVSPQNTSSLPNMVKEVQDKIGKMMQNVWNLSRKVRIR